MSAVLTEEKPAKQRARATGSLMARVHALLCSAQIDKDLSPEVEAGLIEDIDALAVRAYTDHDEAAKKEFHALLYTLNTKAIQLPWNGEEKNGDHYFFQRVRNRLEAAVERHDMQLHAQALAAMPTDMDQFGAWIVELIQSHPSNVSHPFFAFLRDKATFSQMREFFHQEAPMDLHFVDVLLLMMPAMHGPMKMELAANFWDEMGNGTPEKVHRAKRQVQMRYLDHAENDHLDNIDYYCWEELALANLYLQGAMNRSKLPQLIGNMLATETMVPGRVECQVAGWQRNGLPADALEYLQDHTSIDIEHAAGWLNNMVVPLLRAHPDLQAPLVFGTLRRLRAAQDVCDRMMQRLPAY
ncbi:MAG: iron-containing redox enzyme family protein [Pseudomonadota bacterium]